VHFYQEALRQFPVTKDRETTHRGFVIKFRLVAHFCPFKATYNSQNQPMNIEGGEIDFLFKKLEKEANAGEMVVSQDFYKYYHQDLESEGFGFTPFVAADRKTQLYLLVLPVLPKEAILSKPTIKPFFEEINKLNPSFALFTKNSQKNGGDGLKTPVKSRGQF